MHLLRQGTKPMKATKRRKTFARLGKIAEFKESLEIKAEVLNDLTNRGVI